MKNLIVILKTLEDVDRLHEYADNPTNKCTIGKKHHFTDFNSDQEPYLAMVVSCHTDKSAFQLSLKFNTI